MIKRIDINKFGCFSDFVWNSALREGQTTHECKRLNILYGRNYSGKTTLSRVLRSFEIGCLPDNFSNPEFSIITDEGVFSQINVNGNSLDIRVYNNDFVDENLSFLKDYAEGEVETFAILGSENKEIEEKINGMEVRLGDVEAKTGLRYELTEKRKEFSTKNSNAIQAERALEEKLRRYANDVIKPNRAFGSPGYNIAAIKRDIAFLEKDPSCILDENEVQYRQEILKEDQLPDIEEKVTFQPTFTKLHSDANNILEKEVKPSVPIQDLLDDAILQSWVHSGISHHREKRSNCGFCGQPLPSDLWEKLDAHFSKESSDLQKELAQQILAIQEEIEAGSEIHLPEKDRFYVSLHESFVSKREKFFTALKSYQDELKRILNQIQARQENIFENQKLLGTTDVLTALQESIEEFNNLIESNNSITETFQNQQEEARDDLRKNAVAAFMRDIDLSAEKKNVANLKAEVLTSEEEKDELAETLQKTEDEIENLLTKLQDEKKGAMKVNEYLNHYFGHEGLCLEAVEDSTESKFKFQIMRGGEPAYNMSEGECSLVSFCYFMARLEDTETKGKDLVIYIDDPISSLDSNHIFFVFSLIESILALPDRYEDGSLRYRYKQLFVSTHNLDFFKYLMRLNRPKNNNGGTQFFLIEKEGEKSTIRLMPKYMKDYQTEFHYLFHQIYRCKDGQDAHENHEIFYNFGNNLRKFLEAYLFYKYPYKDEQTSPSTLLLKFFGEDAAATALTNRVGNELSHLQHIFDRSMRPIEIPEIPKVANFVLNKMYEKDKEQFNALLQSIGEPER